MKKSTSFAIGDFVSQPENQPTLLQGGPNLSPTSRQQFVVPHPEPLDPQRIEGRFTQRLGELRLSLAGSHPEVIARQAGARYLPAEADGALGDRISLSLWSRPIIIACGVWVAYPQGDSQPLPAFDQALLLYYLSTADGTPLTGEWIAFSELPDGRFYNQAFQGYTGRQLAGTFQEDCAAFEIAAQALGGHRQPLGDAAFAFQALPRAPLLAVYWQGDEDFPSSCQLLFDLAASHYLPTEAYAILGSTLTRKLIKARS
jgi:hypothetical protein